MNIKYIIVIIIVLIVISILTSKLSGATEKFSENFSENELAYAKLIQKFIVPITDYKSYIKFLKDNKYSRLKIYDTFISLKTLKKNGKLTVDEIMKYYV